MNRLLLLLLSCFVLSCFVQAQNINIKGFGDIPVKKQGDNFILSIGNLGEFTFQGNLESKDLTAKVTIEKLSNLPGVKVLSNLGLQNILLNISGDGLFLNAQADTKSSLKKVCDLFKITAPFIEVSAFISPKTLELEGNLEFPDGPVEFFSITETGTVVKFSSASIATTLEPGSAALGFTTNLLIKPTQFDPELDCSYSFSYDIVSQTLTGSGSMMSTWVNPLGTSEFLDPETIVFSNAAVEMGINVLTLMPVNLGFAIEQGKLFTLDFAVSVSIDPVGKEVSFSGSRDKMNANDFTTFLREGFGLQMPDVLPDIYYIEEPEVLFAPNGGKVGNIEIDKGIALSGLMHIGDAMQGPVNFSFDMENELKLHLDLEYDFKKFVMNEVRKIKPLAPIANEILNTFQVRKLYVDLEANKSDLNFKGKTQCDFEIFGASHHIEFEAALDAEVIKQKLLNEVKKAAGPEIAAITEAVGQALSQSKEIAAKAWGDASKMIGTATKHSHADQAILGALQGNLDKSKEVCDRECVPNLARQMYAPILGGGNHALEVFYDQVIDKLALMVGANDDETRRIREDFIKAKWHELNHKISGDWNRISEDRTYVGYYIMPESATNGGHIYRRIINEQRKGYENLKNSLWNKMMNARLASNEVLSMQNRWKGARIHIENGPVEATEIGLGAWSAMWLTEKVQGTQYVRLKNRWKGTYLQVSKGNLACAAASSNQNNAMWELEKAEGEFVRIKNRKDKSYLNVESGPLTCSKIEPGWHSAMWNVHAIYPAKVWNAPNEKIWNVDQVLLASKNKAYQLVFQGDGNLVLLKYGVEEIWSTATYNKGAKNFRFQNDGNLVITNASNNVVWASNSYGKNGKTLFLQNDGNLVIHAPGSKVIWETRTNRNPYPYKASAILNWAPGTTVLMSANKNYRLNFQADGNLMLLKYNVIELWSTGSYGKGADRLALQADGNLVVYRPGGAVWNSGSHNRGGKHLILQDDGNLVLYTDNSQPIWATNTVDNSPLISFNPRSVSYDHNKGCGTIYKYGLAQKTHCGWSKNWHTVLIIGCINNSTADNKILFYDKNLGRGEIYRIDNNGNMTLLKGHEGWSKHWSRITWEAYDGCNGVIKFEQADGYWEKYNCDDQGNISLQSKK